MPIVVSMLGVAFAAFCVWLSIRITNRRERWARRTALALALLLVAYPLSIGPVAYVTVKLDQPRWRPIAWKTIYAPIRLAPRPRWLTEAIVDYQGWWMGLADESLRASDVGQKRK
jgi:hypothetical protein